jgi:hypothetical protein
MTAFLRVSNMRPKQLEQQVLHSCGAGQASRLPKTGKAVRRDESKLATLLLFRVGKPYREQIWSVSCFGVYVAFGSELELSK